MSETPQTPEPEFIETIIYELSNSMFLSAVAAGIVIGGFAIFAYLQLQKRNVVPQLPILHEVIMDNEKKDNEPEPIQMLDPYGNYQLGADAE